MMLDDFLQLSRVQPFAFAFGADFNLHAVAFGRSEQGIASWTFHTLRSDSGTPRWCVRSNSAKSSCAPAPPSWWGRPVLLTQTQPRYFPRSKTKAPKTGKLEEGGEEFVRLDNAAAVV